MLQKSAKYYEYDTTSASIRSYLTFQYVADGANALQDSFTITETAKSNKEYSTGTRGTAYPRRHETPFRKRNSLLPFAESRFSQPLYQ